MLAGTCVHVFAFVFINTRIQISKSPLSIPLTAHVPDDNSAVCRAVRTQCLCFLTDAAGGGACSGGTWDEGSRAETRRGRVSSQGPSSSHPPAWPPAQGPPCQQAAVSPAPFCGSSFCWCLRDHQTNVLPASGLVSALHASTSVSWARKLCSGCPCRRSCPFPEEGGNAGGPGAPGEPSLCRVLKSAGSPAPSFAGSDWFPLEAASGLSPWTPTAVRTQIYVLVEI